MYRKYAEYMMRVIKGRTGNYLAFFPSYRFLEEVWEAFMELPQEQIEVASTVPIYDGAGTGRIPGKIRTGKSTQPDRLLCDGWYFSEGIDTTEDKLIGAMIIGTGLLGVSGTGTFKVLF